MALCWFAVEGSLVRQIQYYSGVIGTCIIAHVFERDSGAPFHVGARRLIGRRHNDVRSAVSFEQLALEPAQNGSGFPGKHGIWKVTDNRAIRFSRPFEVLQVLFANLSDAQQRFANIIATGMLVYYLVKSLNRLSVKTIGPHRVG